MYVKQDWLMWLIKAINKIKWIFAFNTSKDKVLSISLTEDLYQYWGDLITPPTGIVFKVTGAGDEKGPG